MSPLNDELMRDEMNRGSMRDEMKKESTLARARARARSLVGGSTLFLCKFCWKEEEMERKSSCCSRSYACSSTPSVPVPKKEETVVTPKKEGLAVIVKPETIKVENEAAATAATAAAAAVTVKTEEPVKVAVGLSGGGVDSFK
ncbi:hypothetical protein U1Q18_041771 [Sarracenia purpurea var. burkii]